MQFGLHFFFFAAFCVKTGSVITTVVLLLL